MPNSKKKDEQQEKIKYFIVSGKDIFVFSIDNKKKIQILKISILTYNDKKSCAEFICIKNIIANK